MNLLQIHEPGETPLPHENTAAVGIDLGTTYSVVAIATENSAEVVHNIHGHALVPSVVYYAPDGKTEVGFPARQRYEHGEKNVIASVKRLMGRGLEDIRPLLGNLPYDVAAGTSDMIRLKAGGREVTPVEVSAEILKNLKRLAEQALGKEVAKAVITVPAYFDDAARAATKDAARLAGIEVLRLVNEPTAAALAYGLDKGIEGIYAIYDLGGGTFDISLLKLQQGVFQVLATGGDTQLGGDDFDQAIAAWMLTELGLGDATLASEEVGALVALARKAKHELTQHEAVAFIIPPLVGGGGGRSFTPAKVKLCPLPDSPAVALRAMADRPPHMSAEASAKAEAGEGTIILSRQDFDQLIYPYVEKAIAVCRQALLDAGLTVSDVKGVVMVGGSTRVPLVVQQVQEFFAQTPLTDVNPDEVVALGAAIQAYGLTQGSSNLLLDVIPLSLGLETMGGLTEKILERNTPIPVSISQEFTTYQDGQSGMQIHIVQGEREMVSHNRSLARFELAGIPPLPAGIARVKVEFTVDADGMLTVSAEEKTTHTQQSIHVKPSYGLEPEQIEKMLMDSMEHARQDITERLVVEARVEAERAIFELESAMKQDGKLLEPAELKRIERQMQVVRNVMSGSDRDYIDAEVQELGRIAQAFAERRMDKAIGSALKGVRIEEVASHQSPVASKKGKNG